MLTWLANFWSAIWPNIAAEPFVAILAFAAGWFFRNRIGRAVARWWDKHHGPKARARHVEALRQWHRETGNQPPDMAEPPR